MADTNEQAREVIAKDCWLRSLGMRDKCPVAYEEADATLSALAAAKLAIIDTRTHRPVRVHTFDKDDGFDDLRKEVSASGGITFDEPVLGLRMYGDKLMVLLESGPVLLDPADLTGGA